MRCNNAFYIEYLINAYKKVKRRGKMKKKILSVLLAIAMVAASAGCGNANNGGASAPSSSSEVNDAGESSADNAADSGEAESFTLLVWAPSEDQSDEYGNWLSTMCNQFNDANPQWNITFEYGVCPEGDAKTMVTQDVEAAADIYMFANDNLTALVASNAIARLGGETESYVKSSNSQSIVDSVSLDDALYGVPFTTNTWFMYYDTSAFSEEEAGSLDAMLAKEKVAFPLTNSWYIASFFVANGCTLFGNVNDESQGIDFSGDKAVAVTDYLVDMVANPNFVNDADGAGMAGLRDGSIKAIFSGSWDYNPVKEVLGDNFGARELPAITIDGAKKQLMAFAGTKAIGVNPNADNMEAAVALARYLGSPEAQQAHYELRGVVPCNTELLADPVIAADVLVKAQNNTFESTSIIQPFVTAMNNYWSPAENFGKSLINKEVTHANAEKETEKLNTSMNSTGVE